MKRKVNFMMQSVGGESLLVPLGSQVMYMNGLIIMNNTAAYVWEMLAQERTLDELTVAVVERFDVDPTHARVDVRTFLDEITQMGLLEQ